MTYLKIFLIDSFVILAEESLWPSLFGRYYMGISSEDCDAQKKENQQNDDDMLFYVQCKHGEPGYEVCANSMCRFYKIFL